MLPAQPNQSLIDGLTCLGALAGSDEPTGGRELARRLGMEPTRVHRLLKTLAHLGIAQQTSDRRYQPGPGMHVLSAQALHGSGLLRQAIQPLADLHQLGQIVAMGVLWRDQICYLYHATPEMNPAMAIGRAGLYPATQSGIGLALLARQADEVVRARIGTAPHGFASIEHLLGELERIRTRGYALCSIPHSTSRSMAMALAAGSEAAVALSGRFTDDEIPRLGAALRAAVARIESTPMETP